MHPVRLRLALAVPFLLAGTARADDASDPRWEIHAGPAVVRGLRVALALPGTGDPDSGALKNRTYDDGFNRVDATGNVGDGASGPLASRTGNFGFTGNSQVSLTAGTLALHTTNPADTDGTDRPLRAATALNVGTSRVVARPGAKVAVKLGVDFDWQPARTTRSDVHELATVRVLTDTYRLGGVVPQQAPYTGHFTPQPGDQRIGDTPTRSVSSADGIATGTFDARASALLARLGPSISFSPARPWELQLAGGLAAARLKVSANESVSLASSGLPTTAHVAAAETSLTRTGVYAEGKVTYRHGERWNAEIAASHQDLGRATRGALTVDARRVTVVSVRVGRRF